jgi:hypothetical protein
MSSLKTIWIVDYRDNAGKVHYVSRQADTEADVRALIAAEAPGSEITHLWLFLEPLEPAATPEEPAT